MIFNRNIHQMYMAKGLNLTHTASMTYIKNKMAFVQNFVHT